MTAKVDITRAEAQGLPMKRKSIALVSILAGLVLASVAVATLEPMSGACPIDGGGMYFTGQTKTVSGKLLYQYKCPQGHTTWVVQ